MHVEFDAGVVDADVFGDRGARLVVDWLLSPQVQAAIPDSMYMYPVDSTVELPEAWVRHAPLADDPHHVAPDAISANRDAWIEAWTDIVIG